MKKNKKTLIIVSIAAVALVGIMLLLIFLPKGGDNNDGTATYDEGVAMSTSVDENGVHQVEIKTDKNGKIENNSYGTLMDYVPAEIKSMHVENESGSFDVTSYTPVNDKGETDVTVYTLVGFEDFELQAGNPDSIANVLAKLDFSQVLTLEAKKGKDYGFDSPRATATVTYTDDTKAIIIVGDDAPQGAGTYVKFGDGDAVYLVDATVVAPLLYGANDLISRKINESVSDSANTQASLITITGTGFDKDIELKLNDNGKNSATYVITKPSQVYANENESSLVSGSLRGLQATAVKMVNPSDNQLEKLGLKKPYANVKAVFPDTTVELSASKVDADGNVYIMVKDVDVVYQIAATTVPWATTSYEKLVSEYVLNPKMIALSSMSVNDGSKTYDFNLSSKEVTTTDDEGNETTSTTTTVQYNGKELETAYFDIFYQNVAYTQLAEVKSASVSGNPVFSVKYTYRADGSTETVNFYSTGDNRYIAEVNGVVVGTVYKANINKLAKQVSQVANNKQVDTIL